MHLPVGSKVKYLGCSEELYWLGISREAAPLRSTAMHGYDSLYVVD